MDWDEGAPEDWLPDVPPGPPLASEEEWREDIKRHLRVDDYEHFFTRDLDAEWNASLRDYSYRQMLEEQSEAYDKYRGAHDGVDIYDHSDAHWAVISQCLTELDSPRPNKGHHVDLRLMVDAILWRHSERMRRYGDRLAQAWGYYLRTWRPAGANREDPEDREDPVDRKDPVDLIPNVPWRELPERYGPWQTVHKYYTRWEKNQTLKLIFLADQRWNELYRKKLEEDPNADYIQLPKDAL